MSRYTPRALAGGKACGDYFATTLPHRSAQADQERHAFRPPSGHHQALRFSIGVYMFAITLTVLFDLSRIASLGAILYIVMDIAVHWGVLRTMRKEVGARPWVLVTAIVLDMVILIAFVWIKAISDPLVLAVAAIGMLIIFVGERMFLARMPDDQDENP